MFCSKCGEKNEENDSFCRNCGAPLGKIPLSEESEVKLSKKEFVCTLMRKKGVLCSLMVVLTVAGVLCYAKLSDVSAMDQKQSATAAEASASQTAIAKEKITQTATQKETTTQVATTKETAETKETKAVKETTVAKEKTTTSSTTETTPKPVPTGSKYYTSAGIATLMQRWNGEITYANTWNAMNSVGTEVYNFSDGNGSIEVKTLSTSSTGNLIEANVGPNESCSIRMEVYPGLLNDGLVVTKSNDGIITFTNDSQGIILRDNIVSYPKQEDETQSAYLSRCIDYLVECCTDAAKAKNAFTLSDDYIVNTKSAIVMTDSDKEWRACTKLNYTGNPIKDLSGTSYGGFGYLTVVFDKSSQCFVVQTYVAQRSITNAFGTPMAYACYGLKYKVN